MVYFTQMWCHPLSYVVYKWKVYTFPPLIEVYNFYTWYLYSTAFMTCNTLLYGWKISSRFPSNSEANASELLEKIEPRSVFLRLAFFKDAYSTEFHNKIFTEVANFYNVNTMHVAPRNISRSKYFICIMFQIYNYTVCRYDDLVLYFFVGSHSQPYTSEDNFFNFTYLIKCLCTRE